MSNGWLVITKSELINYWKSFKPKIYSSFKKKNLLQGYIKKVLNDNKKGKNGFITSNKKDYYFILPKHIKFIENIELNTKVEFEVLQLNDGKKRAKILKIMKDK